MFNVHDIEEAFRLPCQLNGAVLITPLFLHLAYTKINDGGIMLSIKKWLSYFMIYIEEQLI